MLDMNKPHKGNISFVSKYYPDYISRRYPLNLGYLYLCHFENHPYLRDEPGTRGHTSLVVAEDGNEIETLNSRYTIVSRYEENS